jgi:hypothetical protein
MNVRAADWEKGNHTSYYVIAPEYWRMVSSGNRIDPLDMARGPQSISYVTVYLSN